MNRLNCLEFEKHRTNQYERKKNQLNPAKEKMNRIKHETKLKTPNRRNLDMFMNSYEHGDERKRWRREETYVVEELG